MSKPPLLREAAGRGVLRVRLLLDDLYTDGLESLINGLGAHANVEIRLFNPLPTRGSVPETFRCRAFGFRAVEPSDAQQAI